MAAPAQVMNAGVQNWSVHIVHAVDWPPPHWDAQCWAPHETTVPQQAAQAVEMASFAWRHVATQVASPDQFEER
jgi:hypothetical protein